MEALLYLFIGVIWMATHPIMGFFLYILPLLIAVLLGKKNVVPIVLLNIFFGAFVPLWLALLVWAIFGEGARIYKRKDVPGLQSCIDCGKFFSKSVDICPRCWKKQPAEEQDKQESQEP